MHIIDFLENSVREIIKTEIINIAQIHGVIGGGLTSIPRNVFCIVDFLGAIAFNNNTNNEIKNKNKFASTRKSVRFINDFFPSCYKNYSHLIVSMWRHGTIHNLFPYSYFIRSGNKKLIISWTSNPTNKIHNRNVHMKTFDKENEENYIYLSFNTYQLAIDLKLAFEKFIKKIDKNPSFMRGCQRRLKRTRKFKNFGKLKEFKHIKKDFIYAHANTKGSIDNKLQVTWYSKQ